MKNKVIVRPIGLSTSQETKLPRFIVDVYTPEAPRDRTSGWNYFVSGLRTIPVGVTLTVTIPSGMLELSRSDSDRVLKEVRSWLNYSARQPTLAASHSLTFEIVGESANGYVNIAELIWWYSVNPSYLKTLIREKARKARDYRDTGIGFVMAVVSTFTQVDATDMLDILYGQEAFNLETEQLFRRQDGLFSISESMSSISAILFVPKVPGQPLLMPRVKAFSNVKACTQVDKSYFQTSTPK